MSAKKLKVLIIGGDERNITKEVEANLDWTHVTQIGKSLTNGMATGAQAVVVITRWISASMWSKARQFAKSRGIPVVQAQTGNYIIHELERHGLLKNPVREEKKKPVPKPDEREPKPEAPAPAVPEVDGPKKISTTGLDPEALWAKYGQKTIQAISSALKPGEKISEGDLLLLLSDPSYVGLPKEDLAEVLPELAVQGVIVHVKGKTWKVPKVTDFGAPVEEEGDDTEAESVLQEKKEAVQTAGIKSTGPKGRRRVIDVVAKLAGLSPGPYPKYTDLWKEVLKYEDFRKDDGTYGSDAQVWHWMPMAIELGVAVKASDGSVTIHHDDKVVLTSLPGARLGQEPKQKQEQRREVKREPERERKQEPRSEPAKAVSEPKGPEEAVRAVRASYDGGIPTLDRYTLPIRVLRKTIPERYWDAMACQTVAKRVKIGHHDNAMPLKAMFDKEEWNRLAFDTLKALPIEIIVPFLKDEMKDMSLVCEDCLKGFVFSVGEQKFYEEKFGEANAPHRCKDCRKKERI